MKNKDKDIDTNNWRYCFFNDIINLRNFDPNNIKMDEKSYRNIFIYYIVYVTISAKWMETWKKIMEITI